MCERELTKLQGSIEHYANMWCWGPAANAEDMIQNETKAKRAKCVHMIDAKPSQRNTICRGPPHASTENTRHKDLQENTVLSSSWHVKFSGGWGGCGGLGWGWRRTELDQKQDKLARTRQQERGNVRYNKSICATQMVIGNRATHSTRAKNNREKNNRAKNIGHCAKHNRAANSQ